MAANTFIGTPSAKVTLPTGEASPASVVIQFAVNAYPRADIVVYEGATEASAGVNRPTDSSLMYTLGNMQDLTFKPRMDPDTKISIFDGNKGTLEFSGYVSGPSLSLSRNALVPSLSVVGKSGVMENLKLSVYRGNFDTEKKSLEHAMAGRLNATKFVDEANFSRRVIILANRLITTWESYNTGTLGDASRMSRSIKSARHRLNRKGPMTTFFELMKNSLDTVEFSWLKESSVTPGFNEKFNRQVLESLSAPTNGFSENLGTLMRHFRLMWIPALDGGIGRLARLDEVVGPESGTIKLSSDSFTQDGAPASGLFPITQVVMTGISAAIHGSPDNGKKVAQEVASGNDFVIGSWPTPDSGDIPDGDVLEVEPPPFLDSILQYSTKSEPDRSKFPGFEAFVSSLNNIQTLAQTFSQKSTAEAVTDLCRSMYRDVSLRASTLRVSVPLDLSIKHGARYSVTNADDTYLFSGFLSSVTHTLRREQGSGQATSSLNFTHVTYPGFSIR